MLTFLLRGRHLSSDDAKLNSRILAAKWAFKGIYYLPNNRTHYENPPTWDGVEPATLGADGQRQTNYATQSALDEL
ncbi:hypothetical protein TNCV_930791 [Trichonephila clavipes]|uniref:Uncharacterized protein n=1 Tax=Trichonephila clavipes TaxID=2585209 RepID=A0A8X6W2H5_TRICX|nr:hypothetical protein TNCV_930791 [Trichonephila clavipes]